MFGLRSRLLKTAFPKRNWLWSGKKPVTLGAETLIDAQTLKGLIQNKTKSLRLLDASWYMPNNPLKGESEFRKETIPGYNLLIIEPYSLI